jgi:hypothetical protein
MSSHVEVMMFTRKTSSDMRGYGSGKLMSYELSLSIYLAQMAGDVELQLSALSVGG